MKKNIIHQLKTDGHPLDGMSYIFESDSGAVVCVDGGMYNDVDYLYEYLRKIAGDQDPVVDAWIITHAHADHTFALQGMGEKYGDRMTVKKLIFRQPDEEFIRKIQPGVLSELPTFYKAVSNFKGIEHVIPSAGDHFRFGGLDIEILFTCADLPSLEEFPKQTVNDTSTVFRVTAENQSILFPGDAQEAADRVMIARYGKGLKSDGVQVAHHGELSSISEFYETVDPDLVFWPVYAGFPEKSLYPYDANRTLVSIDHIQDVFIAGFGTRKWEFPVKPDRAPYVIKVPRFPDLTPRRSIAQAKILPDITNPADPAWDQSPAINPEVSSEGAKPKNTSAELRVLWSEDALYLKAIYRSSVLISDPDASLTDNCHNVRVHLTETPMDDKSVMWMGAPGDEFVQGLRLFPEEKNVGGQRVYNSLPARCTSVGKTESDHYTVCAKINFARKHQKGDVIGFHTEINAVKEAKGARSFRMMLADSTESQWYRFVPAGVIRWTLD